MENSAEKTQSLCLRKAAKFPFISPLRLLERFCPCCHFRRVDVLICWFWVLKMCSITFSTFVWWSSSVPKALQNWTVYMKILVAELTLFNREKRWLFGYKWREKREIERPAKINKIRSNPQTSLSLTIAEYCILWWWCTFNKNVLLSILCMHWATYIYSRKRTWTSHCSFFLIFRFMCPVFIHILAMVDFRPS